MRPGFTVEGAQERNWKYPFLEPFWPTEPGKYYGCLYVDIDGGWVWQWWCDDKWYSIGKWEEIYHYYKEDDK